jgi:hypothetical protein
LRIGQDVELKRTIHRVTSGLIESNGKAVMQEALSNLTCASGHGEFVPRAAELKRSAISFEIAIVTFAILALVAAELMLSSAIRGTNFDGGDGKMAQAVILAAYKFGGFLQFNNINPIQGLGSELLPINVWMNPTYWPFAVLEKAQAANIAAAIALGFFAVACYVMARCFDVPIVPSAIAAQLSIVLFGPFIYLFQLSTVFSLMVGNAVVYAPYMIALGLLSRLEPGSRRSFALITASIFGLLFYSICCDPLWSIVCCSSWVLPFAIVALSPVRPKAVLVRCAALACCLVLLAVSGAAEYLLTLTLSTARFQFPALGDRVRLPDFQASALFYSPYMKYFYFAWVSGWLLGLWTLRGRARVLVVAGIASCAALLAEILVYLLLQNAPWSFPLPVYAEQSLFPLFLVSAVAGYWGALRAAALWARALVVKMRRGSELSWRWPAKAKGAAAFVVVGLVPAAVAAYSVTRPAYMADIYNEPWPNEPELVQLFADNIAVAAGKPFRGSILFGSYDYPIHLSVANLWVRGVPTTAEMSQLVTPQSMYFAHAVLGNKVLGLLNTFLPHVQYSLDAFLNLMQMIGMRYWIVPNVDYLVSMASETGYTLLKRPTGAHHNREHGDQWRILELPHANIGNYSPVEFIDAETAAEMSAVMSSPDFDFTKQVVLSTAIDRSLVPARNMQMSLIRGGLHVSGHSDGTSLVVLPQQFSHCLRARDESVRLVRANLMMTGMIFSGEIDTDIIFDYGLFTPRCRWADLSDIKKLKMQIDEHAFPLSGEGLFPNWETSVAKFRAAASAIK